MVGASFFWSGRHPSRARSLPRSKGASTGRGAPRIAPSFSWQPAGRSWPPKCRPRPSTFEVRPLSRRLCLVAMRRSNARAAAVLVDELTPAAFVQACSHPQLHAPTAARTRPRSDGRWATCWPMSHCRGRSTRRSFRRPGPPSAPQEADIFAPADRPRQDWVRFAKTACSYLFCLGDLRRRTPGPPPFSSMNSTPASFAAGRHTLRRSSPALLRFDVLQSDSASSAQVVPRLFNAPEETWVMFETVIEPVLL
jgi:hypothetical protein